MKTFPGILSMLFAVLLFAGCKKDKYPVIKFEITTTAPIASTSNVITKVGLMASETATNFTSGSIWTKNFTAETDYRPIVISMNAQSIVLTNAGTATLGIYVDNNKKATQTFTTTIIDGKFVAATSPVTYTIN